MSLNVAHRADFPRYMPLPPFILQVSAPSRRLSSAQPDLVVAAKALDSDAEVTRLRSQLERLAADLAAEKQAVAQGGQELARLEQTLRKLQEAEEQAIARAEQQARVAQEAEAKAQAIAAAAAAAAANGAPTAPPVVIEKVVEKVVEVPVPAEGEEGPGGALGLLNSLGIVAGGGLGGFLLLQQGKAKKEREEFEGALGAEQKLVASLKQQAEGVRAALEDEQQTVAKLRAQMQAQQAEASRLLDTEKRERAAAERSVSAVVLVIVRGLRGRGSGRGKQEKSRLLDRRRGSGQRRSDR